MELVYKSFDGEIFNTEEECLEYEQRIKRSMPKMITIMGEDTTDLGDAEMILVTDENESAWMICELEKVAPYSDVYLDYQCGYWKNANGTVNLTGLWIRDFHEDEPEYLHLPLSSLKSLKRLINNF